GAEILVDDIYIKYKSTNTIISATKGLHKITFLKYGYRDTSFTVNFEEGKEKEHPIVDLTSLVAKYFFQSNPTGAQLWVDGVNSGKVTPDTVSATKGSRTITLKHIDYRDTSFTVTYEEGKSKSHPLVVLRETPANTTPFGPVKIWETVGADATQPSGLILKSGIASGIGTTATNRLLVDFFYNTTGYDIVSASISSSLTRVTYFKAAGAANLTDGTDAPAKDATWTTSITNDRDNSQYYWVFDADGHYSKIKIVNFGITSNLKWIEIQWLYNPTVGNRRF
ncbi:MAG: PEGA domain-containing protein, partial [Ignavibacteriaceae bacterium]|nr:PEGA domain-containing protein [Ignavibacteriaceae bacterium]